MSVVISVRIPRWVKEKLESFGIDVADAVRRSLIQLVDELERRDIEEKLEFLRNAVGSKLDPRELSKLIDEERRER